jgi:hypothetical protein
MPELGYVRFSELEELRGPFGLAVERDEHFRAVRPLSAYAEQARLSGRIISEAEWPGHSRRRLHQIDQ